MGRLIFNFQSYLADYVFAYYVFLSFVLIMVNRVNVQFQSEEAQFHLLLSKVKSKEIMSNFIKADVLDHTSPFAIDVTKPDNVQNLKHIYFG